MRKLCGTGLAAAALWAGVAAAPAPIEAGARDARTLGTRAIAHRPGGRTLAREPKLWGLTSRLSVTAGEPTLGITRRGDLFYTALKEDLGVEVLRSKDRARTWDVVSPRLPSGDNAHVVSLDPYIHVDEDTGRVFNIDLTVACSYLSFTDDGGRTWTTNPLACGRPINDHQTLFTGPPVGGQPSGNANVVYYCWNDVASSSCSKSIDGGLTFAPTGSPAFEGFDPEGEKGFYEVAGFCGGLHGHGASDRRGWIYLPREYCGRPFLAVSKDEGATWERTRVASLEMEIGAADPSVAVDRRGTIYFAFIAEDRLPYVTASKNGGRSWTRPLMIAGPGVAETNLLTIDASRGRVAFAYMGTEDRDHPKTWNGYVTIGDGLPRPRSVLMSAAVNDPRDPIKLGVCGPGRCGPEVLDFIDVVLDSSGQPWASFVDACDARCARTGIESGNEGVVGTLVRGRDSRRPRP